MNIGDRVIIKNLPHPKWGVPTDIVGKTGIIIDKRTRYNETAITVWMDNRNWGEWYMPEADVSVYYPNKYNPTNYVPRFERLPLP